MMIIMMIAMIVMMIAMNVVIIIPNHRVGHGGLLHQILVIVVAAKACLKKSKFEINESCNIQYMVLQLVSSALKIVVNTVNFYIDIGEYTFLKSTKMTKIKSANMMRLIMLIDDATSSAQLRP